MRGARSESTCRTCQNSAVAYLQRFRARGAHLPHTRLAFTPRSPRRGRYSETMPSNVNPIGDCLGGSFGQQAKLENVSVQTLEGLKQIFTAERKGLDATPPPLGRLPAWSSCHAPDGKWGATEVGSPPGDWDVNAYWTKVRAICFSFFQEMRAFLFVATYHSNCPPASHPRRKSSSVRTTARARRRRTRGRGRARRRANRRRPRGCQRLQRSSSTPSSGNRRHGEG